jgi:hypothetical protein
MKKKLFLTVFLLANYFSAITETLSQTRTATYLNNLNSFRSVFGDQNYPTATATDVAIDDNVYAHTSKLAAIRDSGSSFTSRSVSSLALQGFGFSIPTNATIQNIAVRIKRFKSGTTSVGDFLLSVMQRYQATATLPSTYGKHWTYRDNYAGKIYPSVETQYIFSQGGSGTNGGFNHTEAYRWTPAMINAVTFGLRVDNYAPIGRGSVVIYYDLTEITVQYSISTASASHVENPTQTSILKAPVVYPNPFTTQANIQFTAAENGNAVVELYTILGTKIRTLFSRNVAQGEVYNVNATDGRLSKGLYLYRITNGKLKYTGKILKIQ